MSPLAVISIGIDPTIELGPITLAWHGLTIAIGILLGALISARYARERGLDTNPLYTVVTLVTIGGLVGGKIFYAVERGDASSLVSSRGFTFNGGVILAAILIAVYVHRTGLSRAYLDVAAVGLPLGVAIGRIGDFINGEHYGPATDFFLAVRNTHPDAGSPNPDVAYHSGGLYEMLIGAAILRDRVAAPPPHQARDAAGVDRPGAVRRREVLRVLPALGRNRRSARTQRSAVDEHRPARRGGGGGVHQPAAWNRRRGTAPHQRCSARLIAGAKRAGTNDGSAPPRAPSGGPNPTLRVPDARMKAEASRLPRVVAINRRRRVVCMLQRNERALQADEPTPNGQGMPSRPGIDYRSFLAPPRKSWAHLDERSHRVTLSRRARGPAGFVDRPDVLRTGRRGWRGPTFAALAASANAMRAPAPGLTSSTRLRPPKGAGPDVRRIRYRYGPIEVTPGANSINLGAITAAQKPARDGFITRIRPDMVRYGYPVEASDRWLMNDMVHTLTLGGCASTSATTSTSCRPRR